jgi:hypothetical protein
VYARNLFGEFDDFLHLGIEFSDATTGARLLGQQSLQAEHIYEADKLFERLAFTAAVGVLTRQALQLSPGVHRASLSHRARNAST